MTKETDKDMKTFEDLEFKPHRYAKDGIQARMDLGNGYQLSVVSGKGLYNDENTYEVAVFDENTDGDSSFARIGLHDDVIGWQTPEEINTLIKEVVEDVDGFRERVAQNLKEHEELMSD